MLTVFMDRKGDVLFTYNDVGLNIGNRVKHDGNVYIVVDKTLNVDGKFYEIILHKAETEFLHDRKRAD